MGNNDLKNLPNIGETLKQKLSSVGIDTPDKLLAAGSIEAYKRLKAAGLDPCCSMLYAMEGAVRGIRWHDMEKEELEKLKQQVKGI